VMRTKEVGVLRTQNETGRGYKRKIYKK